MEDDPRPFESVKVDFLGAETGHERFTRDDYHTPPPVCYWRNNLTALSQRFNLYFVASRENIAVYRPEFPFQRLGRTPQLLVPSAVVNPHAQGYIDPTRPHCINHLVVADLGDEEIVLVSTDSGNVTAYHTRAIEAAIQKDPYRFSTDARSDYVGVRPFFAQWVHESAWGLAVHAKGRMIAVSANKIHHVELDDPSAKVTVYAFALSEPAGRHDGDGVDDLDGPAEATQDNDWHEWTPDYTSSRIPPRNKNYKITLGGGGGHGHNIPNICFVNTHQDPEGRWLLSTDIGGEMKFWDIWRGSCCRTWDFAERNPLAAWRRRTEQGWNVAALDPLAFRSASDLNHFCGHAQAPPYAGAHSRESYDITHIVRLRTPGNGATHPLLGNFDDEELHEASDIWAGLDASDRDDVHISTGEAGDGTAAALTEPGTSESNVPSSQSPTARPESSEASDNAIETEVDLDDSDLESSVMEDQDLENLAVMEGRQTSEEMDLDLEDDDDEEVEEEEEEEEEGEEEEEVSDDDEMDKDSDTDEPDPDLSSASPRSLSSISSLAARASDDLESHQAARAHPESPRIPGAFPSNTHKEQQEIAGLLPSAVRSTSAVIPPIPIIHCSMSHLRLLNGPNSKAPHVFCANILKQTFPPELEGTAIAQMDRLNMIHQIPELGILIVCSQIGRVAICTTTRYAKTGAPGLRVDWVLPTRKQEYNQLRPLMPLLGVALSPIQGRRKSVRDEELAGDQEEQIAWGEDGIDGGIPTTFDPTVLVLGRRDFSDDTQDYSDVQSHTSASSPKGRRIGPKKQFGKSTSSKIPHNKLHIKPWEVKQEQEGWQVTESSRRYRLMLTYADMTVLTYELSRRVERGDMLQGEVSVMDLVD